MTKFEFLFNFFFLNAFFRGLHHLCCISEFCTSPSCLGIHCVAVVVTFWVYLRSKVSKLLKCWHENKGIETIQLNNPVRVSYSSSIYSARFPHLSAPTLEKLGSLPFINTSLTTF